MKKEQYIGLPSGTNYNEHVKIAYDLFVKGHETEAIIVLHGLIEMHLNLFWIIFKACQKRQGNYSQYVMSRTYKDLVNIMQELDLFDKRTLASLNQFNVIRNKVSHTVFGNKAEKITKRKVKNDFDAGLNAAGSIFPLILRFLHQESKQNPGAKKLYKQLSKTLLKEAKEHKIMKKEK